MLKYRIVIMIFGFRERKISNNQFVNMIITVLSCTFKLCHENQNWKMSKVCLYLHWIFFQSEHMEDYNSRIYYNLYQRQYVSSKVD